MYQFPPSQADVSRLHSYEVFEKMFLGEHFDAFRLKTPEGVQKDYAALRYVAVNFAGMLSKLSADMLFEEFPKIDVPDKGDHEFLEAIITANGLRTQFYESALENSYRGDAVFRIRSKDEKMLIEDLNPTTYFPEYNEDNTREEPTAHVLAWNVKLAGKPESKGVFKEKHYRGKIVNELWETDKAGKVIAQLPIESYMPDTLPEIETGIDDFLVVHIPNYRINSRFFGLSDYYDLMSLFFAINNRITKTDNILDKHGDPILVVPPGILDEEGKVRKESFGVIEADTSEAGSGKPEYIVWDAKLESAFSEIDRLVEFMFLTSETSMAAFGLDKNGVAESGRALKFKLLRTIAKKHRKELYFDQGIKRLLFTAQKFAKANNLSCEGVKMTGEAFMPTIEWQDGVINDAVEQLDIEERRLNAGLSRKADSIARLDGITVKEAEEKVVLIDEEKKAATPVFGANPFNIKDPANNQA